MASSRLLILSCSILLFLLHLFAVTTTTAQDTAALFHVCSDNQGNFTAKSTYQSNLNQLLTSLSSSSSSSNTKIDSGFFNVTNGKNLNQVNAMGLCRGDVKPDSCRSCITAAALELPKACPNQKEAFIWYDDCMLRYSNRFFFGSMEFGPWFWMYNLNNVSDADSFNQAVGNLLDGLKSKAAASSSGGGGSVRNFATGNAKTPDSRTIYALVQCTPDLSKQSCIDCLNNATDLLPKCCNGRKGGRVIAPSCNFRYEMDRFYDVTADSPMASPSPSPATSPLPPTTTTTPTLTPTATSPAQSPASQDESPPPAGPPPTTAPVQPPPSQGESPTTSPPGPPQPTAQTPESQDQSPPPGPPQPTAQTPESQDQSPPPPPPPSNSAIQKGKTGHSTFATSVSLLVPLLLLWNY